MYHIIFDFIKRNPKNWEKQIYHTNLPIYLNFTYVSYGPHNTALKMNNPKKEPKLESYGFASKMLIFASIFKNSKVPRADLSYKSSNMFKIYLRLIRDAQYGSEN